MLALAVAPVTFFRFVRPKLVLVLLAPAVASAVLLANPVRPGDILEITVAGRPDLARLRTVQTTGVIWMPRLSEVAVAGLTPDEIGTRLTALLAQYESTRPAVTVRIAPDQDPFVRVLGAVNKPGRHELKAGTRLFDVLLAAGGFTARASGEVRVERRNGTFEDGTSVRRFRLPRGSPTPDALAQLEAVLNGGDIVTAAVEEYVTVNGAVVRPGRYPLHGETTVTAAVSSAGGLTPLGSHRVKVDRRDPATGQIQSLRADLEAIELGREQDLLLFPDDSVEVEPRRL